MNIKINQFITNLVLLQLDSLSRIVAKADAHSKEKNIKEDEILEWKLFADMFNFKRQVQIATDDARRNLYLLAGKEHTQFEDNETTFEQLQNRIKKTKELIEDLKESDFKDSDTRHISLYWMGGMYMEGKDFAQELIIQNLSFHVVTAYDILRANGVVIGKTDYAGNISMKK